jgi:hypothetical protein
VPQRSKNAFVPPKVPVPRLNAGTMSPERPSCRYSKEPSSRKVETPGRRLKTCVDGQ